MGLKRLLRMEHRDAAVDVGDAVLQAFQNSLMGGSAGLVDPTATASVETAVRALSTPFALATVTGPAMITPAFLADVARRLFTSGNAVYRIDTDDALELIPASSFEVGGTARRWVYELETPIPGNSKVDRRRVPADGVVHVRINASALEPWRGRAPWQLARVSASTLANIERSLESDVMVRSAILLPMPDASSPTAITQIKNALLRGMGAYNLIETTAQGFGQGITAAPKKDWEQQRIGSVVPEHNTGLRTESAKAIMQAFGVSPAMFQGDGNAQREARRLMFLDTILPTSVLIADELSTKLETAVAISHNESEYADSQRLGRYLKSLIDAGYSLPDAANIVGLPRTE